MAEMKPRLIRVVDFVAELIEADADRMPLSMKTQADIFREIAKHYRESDNPKMVRVYEEQAEKDEPTKP